MVYNLQYEMASLVLLKTNFDTVIQESIGYKTLHREERRVAA